MRRALFDSAWFAIRQQRECSLRRSKFGARLASLSTVCRRPAKSSGGTAAFSFSRSGISAPHAFAPCRPEIHDQRDIGISREWRYAPIQVGQRISGKRFALCRRFGRGITAGGSQSGCRPIAQAAIGAALGKLGQARFFRQQHFILPLHRIFDGYAALANFHRLRKPFQISGTGSRISSL